MDDDDDDGSEEEDAGPQESRSSASESVDPVRRFEALRELAKHLQSLASTVELEHGKRLRMPKVRAPATMLKLEDEVEELKRSRERSGDALSGLRASGALGDPVGAGFAHGNILEAAIVIAQSDVEVIEMPLTRSSAFCVNSGSVARLFVVRINFYIGFTLPMMPRSGPRHAASSTPASSPTPTPAWTASGARRLLPAEPRGRCELKRDPRRSGARCTSPHLIARRGARGRRSSGSRRSRCTP